MRGEKNPCSAARFLLISNKILHGPTDSTQWLRHIPCQQASQLLCIQQHTISKIDPRSPYYFLHYLQHPKHISSSVLPAFYIFPPLPICTGHHLPSLTLTTPCSFCAPSLHHFPTRQLLLLSSMSLFALLLPVFPHSKHIRELTP